MLRVPIVLLCVSSVTAFDTVTELTQSNDLGPGCVDDPSGVLKTLGLICGETVNKLYQLSVGEPCDYDLSDFPGLTPPQEAMVPKGTILKGLCPKTCDACPDKKNEAPFTASDCSVGDSYAYTGAGEKCKASERNPDSFVSTTCSGATPICAMLQENKRRKNAVCGTGNPDWNCVYTAEFDKADCLQVTKTASCKSAEDAKVACTEWKKKVSTSESKEYTYECDDGTTDDPTKAPTKAPTKKEATTTDKVKTVSASIEVKGIEEDKLVADKATQEAITKGFAEAAKLDAKTVKIVKIGDTSIARRLVDGALVITFEIQATGSKTADAILKIIQSTTAEDFSTKVSEHASAITVAAKGPAAVVDKGTTATPSTPEPEPEPEAEKEDDKDSKKPLGSDPATYTPTDDLGDGMLKHLAVPAVVSTCGALVGTAAPALGLTKPQLCGMTVYGVLGNPAIAGVIKAGMGGKELEATVLESHGRNTISSMCHKTCGLTAAAAAAATEAAAIAAAAAVAAEDDKDSKKPLGSDPATYTPTDLPQTEDDKDSKKTDDTKDTDGAASGARRGMLTIRYGVGALRGSR